MSKDSKNLTQTLTQRLAAIQQALKAPKTQYNSFGKYKYRSCEDILEAVKPHLGELVLVCTDEIQEVGGRVYVKATVTITDGIAPISVSAYAREAETKKGMDDSQITGAASSYARKYALNGLLCIDDNKDADSQPDTVKSNKPMVKGDEDYERLLAKAIDQLSKCETLKQLHSMGKAFHAFKQDPRFVAAGKKRKAELEPDFSDVDPREIEAAQREQLPLHMS